MKVLKVIGWLIIPYIMILFQWKKLDNPRRTAGVVWAAIILAVAVTGQKTDTQPASTSPVQPEQVASAPESETKQESVSNPQPTQKEEKTEPQQSAAESETKPADTETKPEDSKIPGTIGINPEEFRAAFNKASQEVSAGFTIDKITVQEGEAQDTFQYMLTDNIALVGTVNKADGSVRDVMIMATGDGTFKSGADIIIAMGVLIVATNPDLAVEERGGILDDLGLTSGEDLMGLNTNTTRNGLRYHFTATEGLGILFGVADENDQ